MNGKKKLFYEKRSSYFNWWSYIGAFVLFGILGMLPSLMFGGLDFLILLETKKYAIWYILYWIGVTAVFSLVTAYQKYASFDKPMNELSEAAAQVAKGDFSVCLKPVHKFGKKDYVDYMFEDFNQMVEELSSIETLKNDFISDVSHEIKTPLAIIQNYITALQNPELPEKKKQSYMKTIFESTQRLTELVSNILKLNKLENQKIQPKAKEYHLSRQLADCILQYEELLEQKKIEVEVHLEERVVIEADESIVELIWNNLLSNALKFTESGGKITVTQRTDGECIIVQVADSGCGMDENTKKHLFDKFYQGDTSHSIEGNGLGMALVKKAVDIIDGEISVESEHGKGSVFTVQLPLKSNNN